MSRAIFAIPAVLAVLVLGLTSGCAATGLLKAELDALSKAAEHRDAQIESLAAEVAALKATDPATVEQQLADLQTMARSLEAAVAVEQATREEISDAAKELGAASVAASVAMEEINSARRAAIALLARVQAVDDMQELADDVAGLISNRDKFTEMVASVEAEYAQLTQEVQGTLRARRVDIVDEHGTPRIKLSANDSWGRIYVLNDHGKVVVGVSSDAEGNGLILTNDRSGSHQLTRISASRGDGSGSTSGTFSTWNTSNQRVAELFAFDSGGGGFATYLRGKPTTKIGDPLADPGGSVVVYNKTGDAVATMGVDDDGDGRVGAWDRSGKGRKLTPWKP